jgi:hypothetical protein
MSTAPCCMQLLMMPDINMQNTLVCADKPN